MSYWRAYYHLVWTTKNRLPFIVENRSGLLQQSIRVVARDHGAFVHAIGTMPDHIHIAISIPPTIAVAEFVRKTKGSTSHYLNRHADAARLGWFGWQAEYGMFTFGDDELVRVVDYVSQQAGHHAENSLWLQAERLGTPAKSLDGSGNTTDTR